MSLRAHLLDAHRVALAAVDPKARVEEALPPRPYRALSASIIAIGKAAPQMAAGAVHRWHPYVERVLVIAPDGVPCNLDDPRLELVRAGHPLPDERSASAAVRALDLARDMRGGAVLALISGGASALVSAPCEGITFEEKHQLVSTLLASGAPISEVNTVRRHISRIKGGGLTRAAAPTHTFALVVSDVIDGGPHDVGSGPTVPDPTTAAEARAILLRRASRFRGVPMRESLKPGDPEASLQKVRVVLTPADLARAAAERLMLLGYAVRVLPPVSKDLAAMASEYRALAEELGPREAIVRAAEPLLAMKAPKPGRGGRCTHLAVTLAHTLPKGVAFLCAASDGVDGSSGTAGGIVDDEFCAAVDEARCREALDYYDTAGVLEAAGAALPGAPTGTNTADLHVLARA